MNTTEIRTEDNKSFKIRLEKLEGGYISDVSGKRKIYNDIMDITDAIDLDHTLRTLEEDEYVLNINITPKDSYDENQEMLALIASEQPQEEEEMSYEKAKELGIIQVADKFDPNSKTESPEKEIKVTRENAYSIARLKAIDWNHFDEAIPMTNAERAVIAGGSANTLYPQWRKAKENRASFHLTKTRIMFTILAKYYEAHLDIRSSTKDQMEYLKEKMLKTLRELEISSNGSKFMHSKEVMKKIGEMRKHLL